jgi:ATP-dependent helicase HrpB
LFVAFPDRAARRRAKGSDEALMVGGRGLKLAPESVVRDAEFFLAIDADLGRRGAHARALVRVASAIEREWLLSAGGAACAPTVETTFDSARGRVVGRRVVRFRDLPIEEGETGSPDPAEATRLLMAEIRRDPEIVFAKADAATALLDRIAALSEWTPELGLPELSKERVVDALEPWIDGRTSLDDVRATNVADVVRSLLTEAQRRALDEHAPEAIVVPSGMRRALRYEKGRPPVLAVKLQELFGLSETPRVGLGRVPVLLHLLAPNGTPVQVTQDLRSFWNSTYAQVRKDLRGRYPKHPWPEDPWNAPPTHRAKPRRPS